MKYGRDKFAANGSGIGVVAEIEAQKFSLAQKFNRGTELEFSTSAAITPIPCPCCATQK